MRAFSAVSLLLAVQVLASPVSAGPAKDKVTLRDQAQALCYDDATRLCPDAVPDEDKVKACMTQKRSQLSAPCRKIFDQGMK